MGGANAPRSREEGADTIVWLATLPDGSPTGGFWRDRQWFRSPTSLRLPLANGGSDPSPQRVSRVYQATLNDAIACRKH
jgi:hypothetical protein